MSSKKEEHKHKKKSSSGNHSPKAEKDSKDAKDTKDTKEKKESKKDSKKDSKEKKERKEKKSASPTITRVEQKEVNKDAFLENVLNGLLSKSDDKKGINLVMNIVADASHFSGLISILSNNIILSTNNQQRQMCLFKLFIDLLKNHSELGKTETDEVLLNYLKTINTFSQFLETIEDYERVHEVALTLIKGLKSTDDPSFVANLQQIEGPFFSFLLATHSIDHKGSLSAEFRIILNKLLVADPTTLMAAAYFFASHKLDDFNEEQSIIFSGFGGEGKTIDLIKELLGGSTIQKRIAIRLLQSLSSFLKPDSAVKQLAATLTPVIDVLKSSDAVVRLDVAKMISCLPANCDDSIMTNEAQIKNILAPVCEYLTSYEGEFAEAILAFTTPRQSYPKFDEMIMAMFVSYKTSFAALMLCNSLSLYSPKMLKAAFPRPPVSDQRIKFTVAGFKFLLNNKKIEKEVFKGAFDQILAFFDTDSFLQDKSLKGLGLEAIDVVVPEFISFHKSFCKLLLKNSKQIKDQDFFIHFAKAVEKVTTKPNNQFQPQASQYAPFYCNLFTRLYSIPDGPFAMFQLLRCFSPQIIEFPKVLSDLIPSACVEEVKKQAFALVKSNPSVAIACASMPKLGEKEIQLLVKTVQKVTPFDPILFNHFFVALSHLYLKETMKAISELSTGKALNTGKLAGKKKVEKGKLLVTTTLSMIPKIIEGNKIDESQQKQIYEIILSCFPKKTEKILAIKDEAEKLNESFKKLSEVKMPKDLAKKLIDLPLFADSIPIMVKSLKSGEDLSLQIIKTWAGKLEEDNKAFERTQPIIDEIFASSKDPKIAMAAFKTCSNHFSSKNCRSFADFSMRVAKYARENNYKLGNMTEFILNLTTVILCDDPDARYAAYLTLIDITQLDIPDPAVLKEEIGVLISPSQLKEGALKIFGQFVTKADVTELIEYLAKISSMKTIELPHALLIRSILSTRSDYMTDSKAVEYISSMIENAKTIGNVALLELENGLMQLSLIAMTLIVPVIMKLSLKIQYRKQFLTCLLTSEAHRKLFLKEFHRIVVDSKGNSKSLSLFTALPMIIETESSANMSAETFGTIVAELIMWMAFVYSNLKDVGKSGAKSAAEEISECFETMFVKTDLAGKKLKIPISLVDIESVSSSIEAVVEHVSKLEVSKLKVLHKRLKTMLKSKNQSVLLFVGIVDIHFSTKYVAYQNPEARRFNATLAKQVAMTFEAANNSTRRFLANIMPKSADLSSYGEDEDIKKIFVAMTESMGDPMKDFRNESTTFYAALMKTVSEETIEENAKSVLAALRATFPQAPISPQTMLILEKYVNAHKDVSDFVSEQTPNFGTFFDFATGEDQRLRKISQKLLETLGGGNGGGDGKDGKIAKLIAEKFQAKLLKALLKRIMKKMKSNCDKNNNSNNNNNDNSNDGDDQYWFNLICDLDMKLIKEEDNHEDLDFKSEVFEFVLESAYNEKSPNNKKAIKVMKKLMM